MPEPPVSSVPEHIALIRPNRSVWVLPNGQVIDIETEACIEDGSAYSHGIFVKKWCRFRLDEFCPVPEEREIAARIRRRAREILAEHPYLDVAINEDGFPNPYRGDLAHNQAAEEEGWIRIKPLTHPRESAIYAETFSGGMSEAATEVIMAAAEHHRCRVEVLKGGALANRAVWARL